MPCLTSSPSVHARSTSLRSESFRIKIIAHLECQKLKSRSPQVKHSNVAYKLEGSWPVALHSSDEEMCCVIQCKALSELHFTQLSRKTRWLVTRLLINLDVRNAYRWLPTNLLCSQNWLHTADFLIFKWLRFMWVVITFSIPPIVMGTCN
jgi:hypothetical protein